MKRPGGTRSRIQQLARIRGRFDSTSSGEKLNLLSGLRSAEVSSAIDLRKYHDTLCFIRAFPDSEELFHAADESLHAFEKRVDRLNESARTALWDSGISATTVHYPFSFDVAAWLAKNTRGEVSIDWQEVDSDTTRLDELLMQLLLPVETDYFDSGYVSSQEWIDIVAANAEGTDFDWLFAQLRALRSLPVLRHLYESANLPLAWTLRNSKFSKSGNVMRVRKITPRSDGMRKAGRSTKAEIQRPLASISKLSVGAGRILIDMAVAALAVRHRETFHFNHANPHEAFLANVGKGVSIAIFGLREPFRYPLECTMGFLILSNGVPIGYGGSSIFFRQANTGINIFDEYRGSEAAYLWVQVMRFYHHLVGCTRFILNPFQFGAENDEALKSGAFWFYHRLGFRSVSAAVRRLAAAEYRKMRRTRNYRCSIATLRRLASCDMHLTLPAARAREYFDEEGFETASMLATRELGAAPGATRAEAESNVVKHVAEALGIRSLKAWSRSEQYAFRQMAPILAATDLSSWPAEEKRLARQLLRAKGGQLETRYAKLLSRNEFLFSKLRAACR
ncbi:MAG: hypothetical protein OEM50_00980 [Gammaproteobacteria bacterium]|nr:hypothetical protein [Gammaproteobacteria bacterium]MDH3362226.1 hypothetical protein [Gammaproteobacteria bacterium]MDH3480258.1 hypothetical protein [Gammaproteobacteria bacterium]